MFHETCFKCAHYCYINHTWCINLRSITFYNFYYGHELLLDTIYLLILLKSVKATRLFTLSIYNTAFYKLDWTNAIETQLIYSEIFKYLPKWKNGY